MALLGRLRVSYFLVCLLFCCFIQRGIQQTFLKILHPHYAVRSHALRLTWNETAGMKDTFVFPEENVTAFDAYSFFVNEINFNDSTTGNIFIGAKNILYELNINLTKVKEFSWGATPAEVTACKTISVDDSFACHNHIRTYRKLPDTTAADRLYVCGTDAYAPKCRTLKLSDISNTSEASDPISTHDVGVISVHPSIPALWDFQGDDKIVASGFYAANLWNSFDFARYNISYNTSSKNLEVSGKDRTIQSSDDFQIRAPYHPIDIYNVDLSDDDNFKMYLFFFREREFLATDSSSSPVRSRLIRVCKDDRALSGNLFGSLVKAEIYCGKEPLGTPESYGAQIFFYTGLRDTHMTDVKSRWHGNKHIWHKLMYAIFTSEQYAPNGTAVCVYFAGKIDIGVAGSFLAETYRGVYEVFNQNNFERRLGDAKARSYLDCSKANNRFSMGESDYIRTKSGIQQYYGIYLPLAEFPGEVFTKVVTDRACVTAFNDSSHCLMQDVIFLSTNNGKIYKMALTTKPSDYPMDRRAGLRQVSHDSIVSQEWELADSRSVEQLYLRIEGNSRYLYATTYSRVYKFSAVSCHLYGNCRDCIKSRDAQCVWDTSVDGGKCVYNNITAGEDGEGDVPSNIYQNIHTGYHSICNAPPICDDIKITPNYPTGFLITGADTCQGYTSLSLNIMSHSCNESGSTTSHSLKNNHSQAVSSSQFLGRHLYKLDFIAAGNSNSSVYTFFVTTVDGAPTMPISSEVTASSNSTDSVSVTVSLRGCSLHSDPTDHRICVLFERLTGGNSQCQDYAGINVFQFTGLNPCERLDYTVGIENSFGSNNGYNGSIVPLYSPPNPVTGISSVPGAYNVVLSWSAPTTGTNYCDVIGYSVYMNSVKRVDCASIEGTSYTISGLNASSNYHFDVTACSNGGESSKVSHSVSTSCGPPSRVRDLTSTPSGTSSLSFSWSPPAIANGVLTYVIYQECFNQTTLVTDEEPPAYTSDPAFTISSLQPTTLCCIRIFPNLTCGGNISLGDERQACETTNDGSPGPVDGLTATTSSPQSVLVRWYPPLNYTVPGISYLITAVPEGGMGNTVSESTFNLFFHLTDLQNDTEYTITVSARTKDGFSEGPSDSVVATTFPSFPDPPTDVTISISDCMATVTWDDPTNEKYSVDSYIVFIRCNRFTSNSSAASTERSVQFNICPGNEVSPSFSWCATQVMSENDVGPSDFSQWTSAIVPLQDISTPRCFITEDRGHTVYISYTITTAYALDALYYNYTLESNVGNFDADQNIDPTTNNTLELVNIVRNTDYVFRLSLCDKSRLPYLCSSHCVISFTSNSAIPGTPVNITVYIDIVSFTVMFGWDAPPNENASSLSYFVQVSGPDYHVVYQTFRQYIEWPGSLTADDTYSVSVLAHHNASNINGSFGAGPSFKMPPGTPGPCKYIKAIYSFDDRGSRLSIVWEPPAIRNGTIRNYTILYWSSNRDHDCASLYIRSSGPIITTTSDPSVLTMDFNDPEGLKDPQAVRASGLIVCIAAATHAGKGEWNYTAIGREGIVDFSTSGNTSDDASETALYVVTVVTIMAIIAAIVIVVIFAILCYLSKRSKTPASSLSPTSNGRIGDSKLKIFKRHRSSKVATPVEPSQSIRSTASTTPMVPVQD
ncbi:PREDICTED: uncharacterized protein LOC100635556 [Amphimedon queenslandica]|uniref:Protein-tyrosine-phosphatase n=1 Tax=Amphimedon queenslandica TaxID=400682 RepID=A0A1X7VBA7_AMPQE|nr:PREDICTED: uncharacterized protein LOC100635556 [Amphimedon queenslandica]|eukprot:XP_019849681.1 PREDICTED: uncharacterized protein LOC100635556 [Amphimedon queenslandica]